MKYVVFDVEYRRDLDGHALYRAAERYDDLGDVRLTAKDPRLDARWPFKRPVCISWLPMENKGAYHLEAGTLETIGEPEMSEREMLSAFLQMVWRLEDRTQLVSWGGASSDDVQLRAAAMRLGVALPPRLSVPMKPGQRHAPGSLDLMVHMCGDAARVHLAEICSAFRVPCKLTCAPTEIAGLIERRKWSDVKAACEGDVLATAAVLAHSLFAEQHGFSLFGALFGIARLGSGRDFRPYAETFAAWALELERAEAVSCIAELASLTE